MKTLYLSDLDGTLLTSKQALSPYAAKTLRRLIREGLLPDFDEMIDAVGLQLVGAVPDDPAVLAAAARGEPLTAGPAARAFDRIALRLEGKDEPLPPLHRLS